MAIGALFRFFAPRGLEPASSTSLWTQWSCLGILAHPCTTNHVVSQLVLQHRQHRQQSAMYSLGISDCCIGNPQKNTDVGDVGDVAGVGDVGDVTDVGDVGDVGDGVQGIPLSYVKYQVASVGLSWRLSTVIPWHPGMTECVQRKPTNAPSGLGADASNALSECANVAERICANVAERMCQVVLH